MFCEHDKVLTLWQIDSDCPSDRWIEICNFVDWIIYYAQIFYGIFHYYVLSFLTSSAILMIFAGCLLTIVNYYEIEKTNHKSLEILPNALKKFDNFAEKGFVLSWFLKTVYLCKNKKAGHFVSFLPVVTVSKNDEILVLMIELQIAFAIMSIMGFFIYNVILAELCAIDREYFAYYAAKERDKGKSWRYWHSRYFNCFGSKIYFTVLRCAISGWIFALFGVYNEFLSSGGGGHSFYMVWFKLLTFGVILTTNVGILLIRRSLYPSGSPKDNLDALDFNAGGFLTALENIGKNQEQRSWLKVLYFRFILIGLAAAIVFLILSISSLVLILLR